MPKASGGYVAQVKYAWQHQACSQIAQAAPVQNTWYTVLNTTEDVRLINVGVWVAVANETLSCRITVDGNTLVGTAACVFDTVYHAIIKGDAADALELVTNANKPTQYRSFLLEGQSVKVEVRKTTAAGAGTLYCYTEYARLLQT